MRGKSAKDDLVSLGSSGVTTAWTTLGELVASSCSRFDSARAEFDRHDSRQVTVAARPAARDTRSMPLPDVHLGIRRALIARHIFSR